MFIPVRSWRKEFRERYKRENLVLINKYLDGLTGIEIGGSGRNFGLDKQRGAYANIDIVDAETRAKYKGWKKSQLVNILASGDDLPLKDNAVDYVFSSHVIEHFFDPIRAVNEWFRVLKKGGYVFLIIPHKERTFDKNRELSLSDELNNRHANKLNFSDYAQRTSEEKKIHESGSDKDHHKLIGKTDAPNGWERFKEYDFGHHWSVWDTKTFLDLCTEMNWNVIEHQDVTSNGNEFTVILQK